MRPGSRPPVQITQGRGTSRSHSLIVRPMHIRCLKEVGIWTIAMLITVGLVTVQQVLELSYFYRFGGYFNSSCKHGMGVKVKGTSRSCSRSSAAVMARSP